jgi:uncharacterized membrane protein
VISTIEASAIIERPVEDVFRFYRDFRNLPRFLGDVMEVEQVGPATYRWSIQGPIGIRVQWWIRVTEERLNELIRYETVSSPRLTTRWEIQFGADAAPGRTTVREIMRAPLGGLGLVTLGLIGKQPRGEMSSNLHRLKQVMETGRVTDTSHAVTAKFTRSL